MALKDIWENKVNGVDIYDASHINQVAQAVIALEDEQAEDDQKISEIESIAKGANKALVFGTYKSLVSSLNQETDTSNYNVGQNILIRSLEVPDLWINTIYQSHIEYTYESDEIILNQLKQDGYIQVGYFVLSALETQKVDLSTYAEISKLPHYGEIYSGVYYGLSQANFTIAEKEKLAGITSTITGVDTSKWNITPNATIIVGSGNTVPSTVSHAAIFGYQNNIGSSAWRVLVGGADNILTGFAGLSIVGGKYNYVDIKTASSGASSSIVGGQINGVNGFYNVVCGYKNLLACSVTYNSSGAPTFTSDNSAIVNHAAVFGTGHDIKGGAWRVLVGGAFNTVTANGALSLVHGHTNESHGRAAVVVGELLKANNDYVALFGKLNETTREGQVVAGICADPSPNSVLTIGDGTYTETLDNEGNVVSVEKTPHNAFEVLSNNGVYALKVGNTEITEEQLQKLLALIG